MGWVIAVSMWLVLGVMALHGRKRFQADSGNLAAEYQWKQGRMAFLCVGLVLAYTGVGVWFNLM